ncbi:hypothetical protein B0H11DRAFT_2005272 [Mycena galericulata]|nr:hypothetical protein B0H11DRAFT_2005272 [Mycena galericulata]
MAPASPVPSDDIEEAEPKKKSTPKSKKDESEVEDSEDEGDVGEEEYEIEAILGAKKGQFEQGKLGYFVKWKGYSDEHNSWVTEEDAANAKKLTDAYWARNPRKSPKKPAESASSKRPRKSVADDDASDAGGSASAAPKKRNRKSASAKAADRDDDGPPAKKPRKSTTDKDKRKTTSGSRARSVQEEEQEEEIGNMAEHMHAPTWDQLIEHIDTVERADDKLYVYFTLKGGERIREESGICADKFPKMLIHFYESNLRWKEADM